MPKAYTATLYRSISDPEKLAAYGRLAPTAVAAFGGRLLARGTAAAAYEHGLKERTVIAEFPSLEKAIAARENGGIIQIELATDAAALTLRG